MDTTTADDMGDAGPLPLGGLAPEQTFDVSGAARIALATVLAGAGAIHLAMVGPHAQGWVPYGAAFAIAGWTQIVLAMGILARPTRRMLQVTIALNVGFLLAWAWTRAFGMPIGPEAGHIESVTAVDALCALLELLIVGGSVAVLLSPGLGARLTKPAFVTAAALPALAVVALTSAALASPAGTHTHGSASGDAHGDHAAMAAGQPDGHEHADEHDPADEHEHAAGHEHATPEALPTVDGAGAHQHEHGSAAAPGSVSEGQGAATADITHMDGGEHEHGAAECTSVTPAQQAAADDLVADTQAASARYADFDVAVAEGYRPITPPNMPVVHYGRIDYMTDGNILDPNHIESIMYGFDGNRNPYFLGSMYLNDTPQVAPPTPGGCLMVWHDHTNLCINPTEGMTGVVKPDGSCPPGSSNDVTSQMIHVWSIPLPDGPLSHEAPPAEIKAAVIKQLQSGGA